MFVELQARKQVLTKSHLIDVDAFEKLHSSDLLRVSQVPIKDTSDAMLRMHVSGL